MTPWLTVVAIPIVLSLVVNEVCDVSPWLAQRLVRKAAKLWTRQSPEKAMQYEEEWTAIVNDCPGKLTKIAVAIQFATGASLKATAFRIQSGFVRLHKRITDRKPAQPDRPTEFIQLKASHSTVEEMVTQVQKSINGNTRIILQNGSGKAASVAMMVMAIAEGNMVMTLDANGNISASPKEPRENNPGSPTGFIIGENRSD